MSDEPALTRALHELAEAPGPANLADVALTGARRARRKQLALGGLAAIAAAAVIAAPFTLRPSAQPTLQPAAPAPQLNLPANASDECVQAPSVPDDKRVAQENWPDFVQIVIGKLPSRTDYVMQSGYALCKAESGDERRGTVPDVLRTAYAVINLGGGREHGHLTVNLQQLSPGTAPLTCAAVQQQLDVPNELNPAGPKPELLFCDEASGATPLVFGTRFYDTVYVTAAYNDFRVWMESHPNPDNQQHAIGPEALRAVVVDPALAALNQ